MSPSPPPSRVLAEAFANLLSSAPLNYPNEFCFTSYWVKTSVSKKWNFVSKSVKNLYNPKLQPNYYSFLTGAYIKKRAFFFCLLWEKLENLLSPLNILVMLIAAALITSRISTMRKNIIVTQAKSTTDFYTIIPLF